MTDMDKMMIEPCPFCGSEGQAHRHAECDFWIAGCSDADCIAHQVAYDFVSQETAIAAWNTRAYSPDDRLSTVTPEMIRAAREVADGVDDTAFERIFVAMRDSALSPLPQGDPADAQPYSGEVNRG